MATSAPEITPRQPMQEIPGSPLVRDFGRYNVYTPTGSITPTPSAQTDVPLLPTSNPVPSTPSGIDEKPRKRARWRRFLKQINGCMLGKEKASVYWYASLLSVIAALIVTLSSIFGWPPLPIWEYLRHVAG
ncbi:uncharacterized protein B0T15DRAFT_510411 [Chaetomium strumarium]|uniref:Uncharacterized protein n=1 Tax=Chaetomium strumarium TaxID=1170767 RepID=A0AAJ0M385_9PEZI|nr:hypothetical protein B0T15DRAFT_510411 [Chaetomium strumarium]